MMDNEATAMTFETHRLQYHIRSCAVGLFVDHGFEQVTMSMIAAGAKVEEQVLYAHFGTKFDIVLAIYQCINADWQQAVGNLEESELHVRFEQAMLLKMELMLPYGDALAGMMGHLLRSDKIGIGARRTRHVREQGMAVMRQVVHGAKNAKRLQKKFAQLASTLYLIHWTLLLLHVQGGDLAHSKASVAMASKMLQKANDSSFLLPLFPFLKDLGEWAQHFVGNSEPSIDAMAAAITQQIFLHRKLIQPSKDCESGQCQRCLATHMPAVAHCVAAGLPIQFVLPAFPAKSPNAQKTLGKLPDLGEEIALSSLQSMCDEIQSIYPPGAKITICSDGRIFSELVEVSDEDITAYVSELREMVKKMGLTAIEILNLEDLLPQMQISEARAHVLQTYAEPLDTLEARLKTSEAFLKLYNGMHRFIAEDRLVMHPELSATKAKETAKMIALQVIQHSNAWTRLLVQLYPGAVRLSIHPYDAHAEKIGIRLTKAADNWLTPWHGAIMLGPDGYVLMKSKDAQAAGGQLIYRHGRPSHFTLNQP